MLAVCTSTPLAYGCLKKWCQAQKLNDSIKNTKNNTSVRNDISVTFQTLALPA